MNFKTGFFIKGLVPVLLALLFILVNPDNNAYSARLPDGEDIVKDTYNPRSAYVSNQVIVKFKDGKGFESIPELRSAAVDGFRDLPFGYMSLMITGDVIFACSELKTYSHVESAEPNYVRYAMLEPNDPKWPQQFNLKLSNAPSGWNITTGIADVTVAVIDTGVDVNHPDLADNLLPGMNLKESSADYSDDSGHGTAVSGVIGAIGNNEIGIAGAAWKTKILPLRACGGNNLICSVVDEAEAINEAINQGVDVINLSLGGFNESNLERDAVNAAWKSGIVLFAAVGNQGYLGKFDDPDLKEFIAYPAGYENVCGVSSVKYPPQADLSIIQLSDFSNYGDAVSVTAMGTNIWTTAPTYNADYPVFQPGLLNYGKISGTSFSTPIVSGLAALIKSQFPDMNNHEIRNRIESTVWDIGEPGWDDKFGYGLVDFYKALIGGTHIENEVFVIGVTASPIVFDEIIVIVKQKLPMKSNPRVSFVLLTDDLSEPRDVTIRFLPNHNGVWAGRFNTPHVGSIRLRVEGEGTSGALPPLEIEYYKAQ